MPPWINIDFDLRSCSWQNHHHHLYYYFSSYYNNYNYYCWWKNLELCWRSISQFSFQIMQAHQPISREPPLTTTTTALIIAAITIKIIFIICRVVQRAVWSQGQGQGQGQGLGWVPSLRVRQAEGRGNKNCRCVCLVLHLSCLLEWSLPVLYSILLFSLHLTAWQPTASWTWTATTATTQKTISRSFYRASRYCIFNLPVCDEE